MIDEGVFSGTPGYPRGYGRSHHILCLPKCLLITVSRAHDTNSDKEMTNLLPGDGRPQLTSVDPICKSSQASANQTNGFPRLQAGPGSIIALRYREGGHISKPVQEKLTLGSVSVYGTGTPVVDAAIESIHFKWTQKGTGGDRRGVLLHRSSFDDGVCYEHNGTPLSILRALHPLPHDDLDADSLLCKVQVTLPHTAARGSVYTMYWVWDWPSSNPQGLAKQQVYTTCLDVDVV